MPHLHRKHAGTRDAVHILRRELARAEHALPQSGLSDHGVHSARKSLKKCRATLRLLHTGLPKARYRRLNRKLRDAARPLSSVRDARVLLDVLQHLCARPEMAGLREALQREYTGACVQFAGSGCGLQQTRAALRASRRNAEHLKVCRAGWSVLGPSLRKVYKQGRKAMQAVQREPADELLHEWRKQVKYLRYQVRLLEPLRPELIKSWEEQLHALADALGDDHDLSVLRQKVRTHDSHGVAADKRKNTLLTIIDSRRQTLQREALRLGARLYEERPRELARRISTEWKRWKAGREP